MRDTLRFGPPRAIDALPAGVGENPLVKTPEGAPVVEMPRVRELVAERVDQARVLERPTRGGVKEPNLDGVVGEADAVTAPHAGALRLERPVLKAEVLG